MHCYSVNMTYSVRTRLSLVVFSGSRRNVYDGALNNIIDIIQEYVYLISLQTYRQWKSYLLYYTMYYSSGIRFSAFTGLATVALATDLFVFPVYLPV